MLMNRTLLILFLLTFVLGCATSKPNLANKNIKKGFKPIYQPMKPQNPDKFEQQNHNSPILKSALTIFEKKHITKIIESDISDFAVSGKGVAWVVEGFIKTNHRSCPSLLTKKNIKKIDYTGNLIIAESLSKIYVYDITRCGLINVFDKSGSSATYSDKHLLLYDKNLFEVLNISSKKKIIDGGLMHNILDAEVAGDNIYFINSGNELVIFNVKSKSFTHKQNIPDKPVKLKLINGAIHIYSKKRIYNLDTSALKKLFDIDNSAPLLSENTGSYYHKNKFALKNKEIPYKGDPEKFYESDNFLLLLEDSALKAISIDKVYQKSVRFNWKLELCRKDETFYLLDFDGKYKKIINNNEIVIQENPADCSPEKFKLENGKIIHEGKDILKFYKNVKNNLNLRIISNTSYYFYN